MISQWPYIVPPPVSAQIQQSQSELQQVKDEAHTHLGEVAVKNSKLADVEVTCRLLTVRRDILREQRDKLAGSKTELSAELVRSISTYLLS